MPARCYNKTNPRGATNAAVGSNQSNLLTKGRIMADSQPTAGATAPQPNVEYRSIAGFTAYRVGDDGSVWSMWKLVGARGTRHRVLSSNWRKLKANQTSGYPRVSLIGDDGKRRDRDVHILVLTTFVGTRPERGMQARHLDDVPTNNKLENLCWGTPSQNWEDSRRNGKRTIGESVHNAKATVELVLQIRQAYRDGQTLKQISAWSGISWQQVHAIKERKVWKHVNG